MAEINRWKLGLATALSVVGSYMGLMVVASQLDASEPLVAVSFFDESVEGLRQGAKVQMRGVTIGKVVGFGLAEDHRHVEVRCELSERTLRILGIRDVDAAFGEGEFAPPTLRATLASTGLTGLLMVQYDFYDVARNPLPELDFEPPWNYVPTVDSFSKTVQQDIPTALAAAPDSLDRFDEILDEIDAELTELDLASVFSETRSGLADTTASLAAWDVAEINSTSTSNLVEATEALRETTEFLTSLDRGDSRLTEAAERVEALTADFLQQIKDFREGGGLGGIRQTAKNLTAIASGLGDTLGTLRAWARWMEATSRAFDDTLRPLGEDPSEMFFSKEPRGPPD